MVVQGRGQCYLTLMLREEVLFSGISVGFVRHGKTYVSVASTEGVRVDSKVGNSAMVFQSAREIAGGLMEFLRWIGLIEFTPALLNVDIWGKGIKYKLSNISEVSEAGTDV
jgi:hypothetical protein